MRTIYSVESGSYEEFEVHEMFEVRSDAEGELARMAVQCVPDIFEHVADLLAALDAVDALDFHELHPGPVRVALVENEDGSATVLHGDDLAYVVDAWTRVVCGQWNVLPELLGWTGQRSAVWADVELRVADERDPGASRASSVLDGVRVAVDRAGPGACAPGLPGVAAAGRRGA